MVGLSTITYQNKMIIYLDYSGFGDDKEKAKQLIKGGTEEYKKYPPNSVLALVNVANLRFDSEMMNLFKEEQDKSAPYEKKVAVIGMSGLQRIAYNFITRSQSATIKTFDSEQHAKDWLASE
jgi:hypothetical protein